MTITEFLLARIEEDEVAARKCAEMFPSPWEIADRGWRVRIYAAEIPTPDLSVDDEDAMTVRSPVAIEVEPDRHIEDPLWLSERVAHIARHDPDRALREIEAKRAIVTNHLRHAPGQSGYGASRMAVGALTAVYSDHPDYNPEWAV